MQHGDKVSSADVSSDPAELARQVKDEAQRLGFDLAGVCDAISPPGLSHFHQWLDAGYAGEMQYLPDRREAYADPGNVLAGARSIVMLAASYRTDEPQAAESGNGRIARYAWGEDYHDILHKRLKQLVKFVQSLSPAAHARGVVDSAPLLEREFAVLAGLGWQGKNTLVLHKQLGSYFFLSALLVDIELAPDEPFTADHCGTCRACLDACPTDAFPAPYLLDSRRCLSYITIELRDEVPDDLRDQLGGWLFGCDICQEVCPWNRRTPTTNEPAFQPADSANPADLVALFNLDDEAFRQRFRRTPLWRSKRRGLLRNAALVLGNQRHRPALAALKRGITDKEPLIREACAWAIKRIEGAHQ